MNTATDEEEKFRKRKTRIQRRRAAMVQDARREVKIALEIIRGKSIQGVRTTSKTSPGNRLPKMGSLRAGWSYSRRFLVTLLQGGAWVGGFIRWMLGQRAVNLKQSVPEDIPHLSESGLVDTPIPPPKVERL